jgi:hypothetical protein
MDMKINKWNTLAGLLLITFGTVALLDYFIRITAWGWVGILFVSGLAVLLVMWPERSNWAYLIPTYVLWAIAFMVALITLNILRNEAIATYVLASIALPFLVGFLRNQTLWGLLIPAYVLLAVGVMVGLIGMRWLTHLLIPAYVMFAIAIPFGVVYLRDRSNWWALIPAGILGVIGLAFTLATPAARLFVPFVLMLIGGWIIFRQILKSKQ